jgi:hypothetical protein
MYCVLECHSKPINVPTDTNICLYKHQLAINLLITLHSFLTWGNKACNFNGNDNSNQHKSSITVTQINSLLWTLMVHLWSQWQVNNKPLVTLRWSSVKLFSLSWSTGEFRVRVDSVTRYLSFYPVSCPEKSITTLEETEILVAWNVTGLVTSWANREVDVQARVRVQQRDLRQKSGNVWKRESARLLLALGDDAGDLLLVDEGRGDGVGGGQGTILVQSNL